MPADCQRQLIALALMTLAMVLSVSCASAERRAAATDAAPPPVAAPAAAATPRPDEDQDQMTGSLAGGVREARAMGSGIDPAFTSAEAALERGDICGVYFALAEVQLSTVSIDGLVQQLIEVRDTMVEATAIAPSSLESDWTVLTDRTDALVDSIEADPDPNRDLASYFEGGTDYEEASRHVEDWMESSCE